MVAFWRLDRLSPFLFALQEKGQRGYTGNVDKTLAAMRRIGSNKKWKAEKGQMKKQDEYIVSSFNFQKMLS